MQVEYDLDHYTSLVVFNFLFAVRFRETTTIILFLKDLLCDFETQIETSEKMESKLVQLKPF